MKNVVPLRPLSEREGEQARNQGHRDRKLDCPPASSRSESDLKSPDELLDEFEAKLDDLIAKLDRFLDA